MKKSNLLINFTIILSFIIIICNIATGDEDIPDIKPGTIEIYKEDVKTYPEKARINFETAIDAALEKVPGKLLEIELKEEEGYLVYEVEIVTLEKDIIEIMIDAGNREVLRIAPEVDEGNEDYGKAPVENRIKPGTIELEDFDERTYPDLVKISFKEAMVAGLRELPGYLLEIELEDEEGYLIYELEILTFHGDIKEVIIDPVTGEILRIASEREEEIYEELIGN